MSKTRMFTTERIGLLALAVILLVVVALIMANNYADKKGEVVLVPDSTLVKSVKQPADTVVAPIKKERKKSKKSAPASPKKSKKHAASPLDHPL